MKHIGEILDTNERGQLLRMALSESDCLTVVEIGTLDGTGSTKIIIEALLQKSSPGLHFITIEANYDAFNLAQFNLRDAPPFVTVLYGNLLTPDSPLLVNGLTPTESEWLTSDLSQRFKSPNVIDQLPAKIDLLVLDGGEFTSYADYLSLRDRSRAIYLDDCLVRKNRLTLKMAVEEGFKLERMTTDGNGAAYLRRN